MREVCNGCGYLITKPGMEEHDDDCAVGLRAALAAAEKERVDELTARLQIAQDRYIGAESQLAEEQSEWTTDTPDLRVLFQKDYLRDSCGAASYGEYLEGWLDSELSQNRCIEAEIAQLKAANVWISVSERLPEEGQNVIIFNGKGISTCTYQPGWQWCYDVPSDWRPLPKPPQEVENG